jgi:hypothetical protein
VVRAVRRPGGPPFAFLGEPFQGSRASALAPVLAGEAEGGQGFRLRRVHAHRQARSRCLSIWTTHSVILRRSPVPPPSRRVRMSVPIVVVPTMSVGWSCVGSIETMLSHPSERNSAKATLICRLGNDTERLSVASLLQGDPRHQPRRDGKAEWLVAANCPAEVGSDQPHMIQAVHINRGCLPRRLTIRPCSS